MTWYLWLLAIILAIPIVSLLLGTLVVFLGLLVRAKVIPRSCGCCGQSGLWSKRNSVGYYLCDECAVHRGDATVVMGGHEEFKL